MFVARKKAVVLVSVPFALLLSLGCWACLIEPNRLIVHQETISLPNWPASLDGFRVAAISDIHAGSPFIGIEKVRQIVSMTNDQKPDLIVLLGDFVVTDRFFKHTIDPEVIAEALKDLHAPTGIYAVLGNHDWWFDGYRVRRALEAVGIKVLENEVARVEAKGEKLWLAGLADALTRPQDVYGTLSKVPSGESAIVLTHVPDVFPLITTQIRLTLAGHTHGGQVNLPFVGRPVVPSQYGQRYAAGLVVENGKHLFVTTGVGTSIIPIRFRVPPEIAILTLKSN